MSKTVYRWSSIGRRHHVVNPMDLVEGYMLRLNRGKKKVQCEIWCPCTQVCIVVCIIEGLSNLEYRLLKRYILLMFFTMVLCYYFTT